VCHVSPSVLMNMRMNRVDKLAKCIKESMDALYLFELWIALLLSDLCL